MSYINKLNICNRERVGSTYLFGCKSASNFLLDGQPADLAIVLMLTSADAKAVVNFSSESGDCFGTFNCVQYWGRYKTDIRTKG